MRLLTLCCPTVGRRNQPHLTGDGRRVLLAPDEFHRCLLRAGWTIDVVAPIENDGRRLHRSSLPLRRVEDVPFDSYHVYWHMFRDPTQPEVLDWLSGAAFDYGGRPVINEAYRLRQHHKAAWLPVLQRHGLAPEFAPFSAGEPSWIPAAGTRVSPDQAWIETHAFNNNRGDYPERGSGRIVMRFVDNAVDGLRSIVRFGVAFGRGFTGFRYWSDQVAFKSGGASKYEPYRVPERLHDPIRRALAEMGCDVCHVEGVPVGDDLLIFDINPYPTADGRTLTFITEHLTGILLDRFQPLRPGPA